MGEKPWSPRLLLPHWDIQIERTYEVPERPINRAFQPTDNSRKPECDLRIYRK